VAAAAVSGLLFAFGSFMSAKRDSTGGGGGVRMICMNVSNQGTFRVRTIQEVVNGHSFHGQKEAVLVV
jgi:hypothetical protein